MNQLSGPNVALVLLKPVWQKPGDFHWHLHLVYSLKLGLGANTTDFEELIPVLFAYLVFFHLIQTLTGKPAFSWVLFFKDKFITGFLIPENEP